MSDKLKQLHEQQARVRAGGGAKRIEKQHAKNKLTARERLEKLFDPGTFEEIDMFVQHRCSDFGMQDTQAPGEGVVTGFGRIDGRIVYAFAQDFTVIGGTLGEMHAKKICKVLDLATRAGRPVVGLNDSGGARIQEGVDALDGYGHIFFRNTQASGVIPQLSVILGPCAGGAVYSPALTDFVFMVDNTSQMFITGPQVIKAVTGEEVTAEQLGGAATHNSVSGVAQFFARDENECLAQVRTLLSYLPANNVEGPPRIDVSDSRDRIDEGLQGVVPGDPNKPYDVRDAIVPVLDSGSFFEVAASFAQNALVGFGRLDGVTVGIIANQPQHLAGCLDIDASDKIARFVRFCDAFNIPLLTWVDTPGYLPGTGQEYGGIIRHGAKVLYAYSEANVPKLTVIVRKAYGGAYIAMCGKCLGADRVFAWPTAEVAVMGPEGAANIIFRKQIKDADYPGTVRQEKIDEYRQRFANPYVAAARGYVDSVIDPAETRIHLIRALEGIAGKREHRVGKKHGIIPV